MKNVQLIGVFLAIAASATIARAIDLKESKVTQVVNDVQIISANSQSAKPAAVNDVFSIPDILRTGKSSRAELVAKDETITRIGADTIFSFDPASRTINLKQGSLLFHSPHGKGGGTIHTGSATASVLGTTLIVTTTKDGGMKVLNLEGTVEVDHQNKKKQRLKSGQMTFVLPNGQLAPVIVFNLDELIRNSLLVRGFGRPLTSLPLIQNQIKIQNKLIKAGKAEDTGLLVGDSASPNQVEVIDPNTIQHVRNRDVGVRAAFRSDAVISGPSLTAHEIPTPPNRIFVNRSFILYQNPFYTGQSFRGFAGRNVSFTSPEALSIDMSPYASQPAFAFVAAQALNLNTSVSFDGLDTSSILSLIGGTALNVAPGITLSANVADFVLSSPGSISLDGVTIHNNAGKFTVVSGSEINANNIYFNPLGRSTFIAPDAVNFNWSGDGFLGKFSTSDDNVIITDPTTGQVNITAAGNLNIDSTSIQTHYLTLNSGDSILLDATGRTLQSSGAGATANFTAPNLITVRNADFSNFGLVNMAANTITIVGTTFSTDGTYNFGTGTGQANINGPVVAGHLNLINDRIGTVAITDLSQINLTAGPGTGPGIYSYKK